jgi:hypothetical protein
MRVARSGRSQAKTAEVKSGRKTPLELLLAGVQGWETGLRRRMEGEKSKQGRYLYVLFPVLLVTGEWFACLLVLG